MSIAAALIAALVVLLVLGLVGWVWFALSRVDEHLRSFSGVEGMPFEI